MISGWSHIVSHECLIRCTTASSLAWDNNHEQAVDRVTAIAIASKHNKLGALMLRAEAMDAQSVRQAILLVARRLNHKHRITRGFAERMAKAILQEYLHSHCRHCGGRGELYSDGEAILPCAHCGGSGLRRYTDRDRHNMVGSAFNQQTYDDAMGYVRDSIGLIVSGSNQKLRRDTAPLTQAGMVHSQPTHGAPQRWQRSGRLGGEVSVSLGLTARGEAAQHPPTSKSPQQEVIGGAGMIRHLV